MFSQDELVKKYVLGTWFLKIRLISCRRQLWANQVSLIHLENAALQLRKACEMISYLCIAASGIEEGSLSSPRQGYKVGATFKQLKGRNELKFPQRATLSQIDDATSKADWRLDIEPLDDDDVHRVERIHERTHRVLHEFSPFRPLPNATDAPAAILSDQNSMRGDHQWLWNRFWRHAIMIREMILFINLGDPSNSSRPQVVKHERLHSGDVEIAFDPEYLADFTGPVDWAQFDEN
ncbi:hypothetical protein N183_03070 [Sinorhizobium sp. Sb3]|uniref:hypothetical protein n=2 Tax=Rhizobiaceae TaxID=82115 RepID=UPI00071E2D34|nr:hypothetical protein [Sinorhizobium sp. Sb3]KSV76844.1 hypothetical protein N183_03070 [Sinorhizobium sp. Sb3]